MLTLFFFLIPRTRIRYASIGSFTGIMLRTRCTPVLLLIRSTEIKPRALAMIFDRE